MSLELLEPPKSPPPMLPPVDWAHAGEAAVTSAKQTIAAADERLEPMRCGAQTLFDIDARTAAGTRCTRRLYFEAGRVTRAAYSSRVRHVQLPLAVRMASGSSRRFDGA